MIRATDVDGRRDPDLQGFRNDLVPLLKEMYATQKNGDGSTLADHLTLIDYIC